MAPFIFQPAFLIFFRISKYSALHLAFALARFMALRRLVAGQALDFGISFVLFCSCLVIILALFWYYSSYHFGGLLFKFYSRGHSYGLCYGFLHRFFRVSIKTMCMSPIWLEH